MRKLFIATPFLFCFLLFFSSCLTTKQTNLLREPGGGIPSYAEAEAIGEYTVKPGDELRVQISVPSRPEYEGAQSFFSLFSAAGVTGGGEMTKLRSLTVSPEGTVHFPYLGDYQVVGKTTLELRALFETEINTRMLKNGFCIVYVALDNRFFSVIGESSVGRYPIEKEQLTIFQALAKSRDVRPYGDRSKVKVIRQTETGTTTKVFDLRSSDIINSDYYYIQPNDVIYIQPLKRQVWGIDSFGSLFAILSTLTSFGLLIFKYAKGGE